MNKITPNKFDGNPESILDSAIAEIVAEPIDSNAVDRIRQKSLNLASQPKQVATKSVRGSSRRRWFQLAAFAACVFIVARLLMPSSSSTSAAFAQFIEKMKSSDAYSYKQLVYLQGKKEPMVQKVFCTGDGLTRTESEFNIVISDANLRMLLLDKAAKSALVRKGSKLFWPSTGNHLDWVKDVSTANIVGKKDLGLKSLLGRACNVFTVNEFTVWIDATSGDVVQLEYAVQKPPITKIVMKDFEFNQQFDSALFSFDVPEGYSVSPEIEIGEPVGGEECVVTALRGFTAHSKGAFPNSLVDWVELANTIIGSGKLGDSPESLELTKNFGRMFSFLTSMSKDDFAYLGKGKSIEDEKTIVFWYRNKEGQFRAIYSDFTVTDISKSDLPE